MNNILFFLSAECQVQVHSANTEFCHKSFIFLSSNFHSLIKLFLVIHIKEKAMYCLIEMAQ